jgi:virginiamycin B lyase
MNIRSGRALFVGVTGLLVLSSIPTFARRLTTRASSDYGLAGGEGNPQVPGSGWLLQGPSTVTVNGVTVNEETVCPGQTESNTAGTATVCSQDYVFLYQIPSGPNNLVLTFSGLNGFAFNTTQVAPFPSFGVLTCVDIVGETNMLCTESGDTTGVPDMGYAAADGNLIITVPAVPTGGTLTFFIQEQPSPKPPLPVPLVAPEITIGGAVVSPAALVFGSQEAGSTSAAQTVTVTNSADFSTNLNIAGTNVPSGFTASGNCSTSLAPGNSCAFNLAFSPTAPASPPATATLGDFSVADDSPIGTELVGLSGYACSKGVTISPSELVFGSQLVGNQSTAQIVTITNSLPTPLNISSITASLDSVTAAPDFSAAGCSAPVNQGQSCQVNVVFNPTLGGSLTATLTIADNSPDGSHVIALSGTANQPNTATSSSAALNFGSQPVGTNSTAQTLTVTNTGSSALNIVSVAPSADFTETDTCTSSSPLAPQGTCTVSVIFQPTASGSRTGTLTIADDAVDGTLVIPLSGISTGPTWQQVPGLLTQIAVGSAGSVWGINSAGQVFTFNTVTQNWSLIPGQLGQIAVASDGAVWGINSAQEIYRFDPQIQSWDHIPGLLTQIAVGSAGVVWGINAAQQIFRFDPGTQGWDQIPGALAQIAVAADGSVWGVNAQQQIFYFDPQAQAWDQIPGLLTQIAVGSANAVWGINAQQQIFQFDPQTQLWNQIPGLLTQITVGANGTVWGINAAQQTYTFNPQTQGWEQIPGALTQLAVGADGTVWGINAEDQIFELNVQPTVTRTWTQIPGLLAQLAVAVDGTVWGINASQQIFTFNARTQLWDLIPGYLSQIAVGFGGAVWGINSTDQAFRFNPQTQGWDYVPGPLKQIAVGSANSVWGITAQQIFRYNPQTQAWQKIPGTLTQIAVGADGAVWGINSAQQIFAFNPQTQSWSQIPGLLTQIAVGSATAVWGINAAGQIFRFNPQSLGWDQIPGQLTQIAVAYDGVVWGLNSAQQIFTFDTQTQGWDQVPGLLTQIAVGSDGAVWGLNSSQQIFQLQ